MGSKQVIINADDLNHSSSINSGIYQYAKDSLITSSSIIVNKPILESTYKIIEEFGQISFGLHFNLTRYQPLSKPCKMNSILSNGEFIYFKDSKMLQVHLSKLDYQEISEELFCQFNRFCSVFGKAPTHVDSHHYVHSFKTILKAVEDFCIANDIPMRRPENRTDCQNTNFISSVKMTDEIGWISLEHSLYSILHSKHFNSIEIICHPKINEKGMFQQYQQDKQYDVLLKFVRKIILSNYEYVLINYTELNKVK